MKIVKKVSVIGLGKLGLTMLVAVASKGFNVVGFDIKTEILNKIKMGKSHISEPGVQGLLIKNKKRISVSRDIASAVINTDITFIVTATPSKKDGSFSVLYVKNAIAEIAAALKSKKTYHLIVLVSTVLPGETRKLVKFLEELSGKRCGIDFGFCYNPEFIALGNVIKGLTEPDFILVGESDSKAGSLLQSFYKKFCRKGTPVARMNFENAELSKISVNTYVTTKISYANMLGEICEKIEGADADTVTGALGLDGRIGRKYLKSGTSFGGPCFPRDNVAFLHLANKLGVPAAIPDATHNINVRQNVRLVKILKNLLQGGKTLGVLGLSYKPDTDVVEESSGLFVVSKLLSKTTIGLYDPKSGENCKAVFGDKVKYYSSLPECIKKSDVILVSTLWPEISNLKPAWFKGSRKVVIDPWREFTRLKFPSNVEYIALGKYRAN